MAATAIGDEIENAEKVDASAPMPDKKEIRAENTELKTLPNTLKYVVVTPDEERELESKGLLVGRIPQKNIAIVKG